MNSSPRLESHPAMHPMPWRDANGRNLWRLVLCAAVATLILALACSLIS
jgi:anti-sigma-K factor RskA